VTCSTAHSQLIHSPLLGEWTEGREEETHQEGEKRERKKENLNQLLIRGDSELLHEGIPFVLRQDPFRSIFR
jgi:hypothetical protein